MLASGVRRRGHGGGGVVDVSSVVGPTEFGGFDVVLECLIYVEDSAALGAQHPLVAVGGQGVDVASSDIERKCAKSLDSIYERNAVVTPANLTNFLNGRT